MNVILDGSDAVVGTRAIRRYTLNMVREIASGYPQDRFTVFLNYFRGSSAVIDAWINGLPHVSKVRYALPRHLSLPLWEVLNFPPLEMVAGRADLFHALGDDCPPVRSAAYIMTLHGIVYMTRPDLVDPGYASRKQRWLRKMAGRADCFIAVSECTKREFLGCFPSIAEDRVRVIPLGIGSEFKVLDARQIRQALAATYRIRRPYVLYVGGMEAIKNIPGILRAFSILAPQYPDLDLVLVGCQEGPPAHLVELIQRLKLAGRVRTIDYVSQEGGGLPLLYNGAECFVFPSFSEGWTSPPLEAMACGIPVVTSNRSSLPETVGDAALSVDPDSPEAIAAALDQAITDSHLRNVLRTRGLQRSAQFTWRRCADSTYRLYQEVAGRG